ncbi:MAG: UDP-N-acetylglucosamine 1-carboxyvinyltransferase [Candidatus Doudnabacteria bacterium]|nr:UDP-N-acetylglucosamine 1-carboxyvinyltransferase [Candidatus Doudnabacteria bacterium]
MSRFVVSGGVKLAGEIAVQGSKNAAFPVLAACLLAFADCRIENVPQISDVNNFLAILEFLGARIERGDHTLTINCARLVNRPIPEEMMGKLRGSILFAGALLGRFGKVVFSRPGGDSIGTRPINFHLEAFQKLGARISQDQGTVRVEAAKLAGGSITMGVTSVTGTENIILAAVLAEGTTWIKIAAMEPHVQELCRFLNKMGAKISGIGTPSLTIEGVPALRGAAHRLCSDEIETITFCVAAAATRGEVIIKDVDLDHLDAPLAALERMGVNLEAQGQTIRIRSPLRPYQATRIITGVYPQLLTDYQPLLGVLATQAEGISLVHDWIYEGRQGYLAALQTMGASVQFDDVHRARIKGPTQLQGAEIKTPDIRAGASILIAALLARGETLIYNAEIIDRGYERIDERLNNLGAMIQRV